ncbi:MAG: polyphosphate kinase 2 family protein [Bacteroidota bacterium]
MKNLFDRKQLAITDGKAFRLKDHPSEHPESVSKEKAAEYLAEMQTRMQDLQDKLYAQDRLSLLLVFQAMDAAGKDGTIRTVMSGVNPQGCHVVSFKAPTVHELDHDWLWRVYRELPERGKIGIFNRSHYEEVLVTKVHPEFIVNQRLPHIHTVSDLDADFWEQRYEAIRAMEEHLAANGTRILKFFLNVGKEEQKKRFLERIEDPAKNWKFSSRDVAERQYWDAYQDAYEEAIRETARPHAPWFVIPADHNRTRNLMVCDIIVNELESMNLAYPEPEAEELAKMQAAKQSLLNE